MKIDELEWEEVDSSNIDRVAFDADENRIAVHFKSGAIWAYDDCSRKLYEDFKGADSVGKFFHREIKAVKSAERLEG